MTRWLLPDGTRMVKQTWGLEYNLYEHSLTHGYRQHNIRTIRTDGPRHELRNETVSIHQIEKGYFDSKWSQAEEIVYIHPGNPG